MQPYPTVTYQSRVIWRVGPITYVATTIGRHTLQLRLPLSRWVVVLCLTPYSPLWKRAARRLGWDTTEYRLPTKPIA